MAATLDNLKAEVVIQNTLLELAPGTSCIILDVPDNVMLSTLGIRKGKVLQCRGHQLFGGPVVVKTGDRQIALQRRVAQQITVQPI